jgi:formylglycine-generating enzyme required for sulfatase activity
MRKISLILISLLFVLTTFADSNRGIGVTDKSNRIALVIGNSNYKDAPLTNPKNDSIDIAAMLKRTGFEVELLLDANQETMDDAISNFGNKLRGGGVGLFYFAGHGVQIEGKNYLIPIGADITRQRHVKYRTINVDEVLIEMGEARNGFNMLILDACRNNPLPRSFRSSKKGLSEISPPKGTLVTFATSPGDVASDGPGRNSPFAKNFLIYGEEKGLHVETMFRKVSAGVQSETDGNQIPWRQSSFTGDFYFNGQEKTTEVASGSVVTETAGKGSIKVETQPSIAKIYVNQLFEGNSPITLKFPPGAYTVVAKKNGYKNQQESVRVREGRNISLNLIMDKSGSSIFVRSTPDNAKIYLNNEFYGNAPDTISALKAGNYNIIVKLDGYQDFTKSIYLLDGQEQQIQANLSKKAVYPNMVKIPAGNFQMGSNNNKGEMPIHPVYLDEYYIDQYEVTVIDYKNCVTTGRCEVTNIDFWSDEDKSKYCNYYKSDRKKHPINCVDWKNAKKYCEYAGKRLPTEAEWEKAATWKNERKYKYPSGKNSVSCKDAVMRDGKSGCGRGRTWKVGSKPQEINGTYDMAGSVWEWVFDWYDKDDEKYYSNSPYRNPQGPSSGYGHVVRGGGWGDEAYQLRGTHRNYIGYPYNWYESVGFRCTVSP